MYFLYEVYRVMFAGKDLAVSKLLSFFLTGESPGPLRTVAGVTYYVGVPLMCLGLFGGIWLLVKKKRSGLFLLVGVLVPLLVLIVLSPFSYIHDRYVFITLPIWIVLGAVAVKEMFSHAGRRERVLVLGVAILLLADPAAQDWLYFKYQNGNRWDWKGAFTKVRKMKAEGDFVVTTWQELGRYYLDGEVMSMHELDPLAVVESGQRIWFVDDGWVNPALFGWLQDNGELIDVLDVQMPGKVFKMRVFLYDPNRLTDAGGLPHHQMESWDLKGPNTEGEVTTSLLRAATYTKDNRLLLAGFDKQTVPEDIGVNGVSHTDADFQGGGDKVALEIDLGGSSGP